MAFVALTLSVKAADLAVLSNGYEIRHEAREAVGDSTRLYLTADRTGGYIDVKTDQIVSFERDESVSALSAVSLPAQTGAAKKPVDVQAAVAAASKTHSIDPDLISSLIHAESSFNPRAVSPKGAQGLMQLMPGTALTLGVKDVFDPEANVDGGTRYLRELLLRYDDDLAKALAAYNAGPHRVDQYKGIPPYPETRHYVARVIRDFNRKKLASGISPARQPAAATVRDTSPAKPSKRVGKSKSQKVAASDTSPSGAGS